MSEVYLMSLNQAVYLECEMLKEVGGPIRLVSLCPAAGIDPHANSRGLGPWRVLGGNLTSQRQYNCLVGHIPYREAVREGG